jgi:glycosyltransferase involved in cell wall biosynthesis
MHLEAFKLRKLEARAARVFHIHVTVSEADAARLARTVPTSSIAVVPNGVDMEYFHPGDGLEEPDTLVHVGGLNWYPNADGIRFFLTKIWDQIRRERPGVRLRLVGPRPPQDIQEVAQRVGVDVLGYVPDVRPIVWGSAVFVVPLRIGGGTRLKILDAMAMGKAVVSTSIGCDGLEVRPGEDIVVADTAGEFASRVVTLLRDESSRKVLGANARGTVERLYSWDRVGERLETAYQRACGRVP